ncbi:MAG: hypothetical protein FGM24_07760 [Candidatus Kapabacteria bacterium]|nr:hypothetical protein [Candidatus Kapabacteria bacterium]
MKTLVRFLSVSIITALCALHMYAQQTSTSPVMQPRVLRPAEYMYTDSLRLKEQDAIITMMQTAQDSAFEAAKRMDITAAARFAAATRMLQDAWEAFIAMKREPTPWELIAETMNIPKEMLAPSAQEVTQRQIMIANSQNVPGVLLRPMGTGNAQVRLQDVYQFFGLTEDVSPRIVYSVDVSTNVEIVIYSTQAKVVATIFRGVQPAGKYEITWNGMDDAGRNVVNGDYIAEVRLGTEKLQRKRILWPAP